MQRPFEDHSLLSSHSGTFALTGHLTEFKNLSLTDREKVMLDWKHSSLAAKRLLFSTFQLLSCISVYAGHAKVLGKAMHYNDIKAREKKE